MQAAFYGQIFAAEFIGAGHEVRVSNIDLGAPFYSAYAAYDDGKLSRIGIANLNYWSKKTESTPTSRNFTLSWDRNIKGLEIGRLTSPEGAAASADQNITWGGMSWNVRGDGSGVQVVNDMETVRFARDRKEVQIGVRAIEAAMLFLKY